MVLLKISIDFDGTITRYPEFFRALMWAMQKDGHEIGILTGHHFEDELKDFVWLSEHGFPAPNFWIGRQRTSNPNTASHKKRSIRQHAIDLHFDDCDNGKSLTEFSTSEKVMCIR